MRDEKLKHNSSLLKETRTLLLSAEPGETESEVTSVVDSSMGNLEIPSDIPQL